MTTIGGVAFRHLDRLPQVGDTVTVEGILIRVKEMVGHRIARVEVARGGALELGAEVEEDETDAGERLPQPLVTEDAEGSSTQESPREPVAARTAEEDRA